MVASASASAPASSSGIPKGQVRIEVLSSSNEKLIGTFKFRTPLTPLDKQKKHVMIGRSTSNQFKEYGLSIQDDEVSTRHAVIHRKGNKFYWKDLHSTNGSILTLPDGDGTKEHLPPDNHHPLQDGATLELGMCKLLINFSSA